MYQPLPPAGPAQAPLSSAAQPSVPSRAAAGGEAAIPDLVLKLLPASLARVYQSGENEWIGVVSRTNDPMLRSNLYEAAGALMTRVRRS